MKAIVLGSLLVALSTLAAGCYIAPAEGECDTCGYHDPNPTPIGPSYHTITDFGSNAQASSEGMPGSSDFSAAQALGTPDVNGCGDDPRAWSPIAANPMPGVSPSGNTIDEFLDIGIPDYIWVRQVKIYESYSPGAIVAVDLEATDGSAQPVTLFENYSGDGPAACPSALVLDVDGTTYSQYDHVVIYFDSNLVGDANYDGNWNDDYPEIDAVEVTGDIYY